MVQMRGGVDRCKVGLVFPDVPKPDSPSKDSFVGMMEWVGSVRHGDFDAYSGGRKAHFWVCKHPAAMTVASQPLESGSAISCRYGRHKGALRGWVGFNPSRSRLDDLNAHFQLMLEQGFVTLLNHGLMRHVELFVDIEGASFSDYCYFDTQLKVANTAYEGQGTVYLGARHGGRSVCAYDKGKQLAEAFGAATVPETLLRLEARVKSTELKLQGLPQLKNPFRTLCVVQRSRLVACQKPAAKKLVEFMALGMSAQGAFSSILDLGEQNSLINSMAELSPPWWNPDAAWACVQDNLDWMDALRLASTIGSWHVPPEAGLKVSAPKGAHEPPEAATSKNDGALHKVSP